MFTSPRSFDPYNCFELPHWRLESKENKASKLNLSVEGTHGRGRVLVGITFGFLIKWGNSVFFPYIEINFEIVWSSKMFW